MLAAAVRRGLRTPLLVGDLPFGSYEASDEQAIATAQRFVKEAGCDAVKLERGGTSVAARTGDRRRRDPGHGPRRPHAADGDRARRLPRPGPHRGSGASRSPATRSRCRRPAASRSCSRRSPPPSPRTIMARVQIPVIGIGAGAGHRRPGARVPRPARHLRRARRRGSPSASPTCARRWSPASPSTRPRSAAARFPAPEHCYSIDDEQLARFRAGMRSRARRTRTHSGVRRAGAGIVASGRHGTLRPGVRAARSRLLRAVRGGRAEHAAGLDAARRPARPTTRTTSSSPARSSTSSTRATGSPTTSSIGSTTRS